MRLYSFVLWDSHFLAKRVLGLCFQILVRALISTEFNLTQIHDKPTREDNLLDLVFTTNSSLIKSTTNAPGISDHDMVIQTRTLIQIIHSVNHGRFINLQRPTGMK